MSKREGLVIKKIADKFWVKTQDDVSMCNARGNLRSSNIFVGDKVILSDNVIEEIKERHNKLIRPPIANIDQLIIVLSSIPKPDFMLVDKLLLFCKINDIMPIICVNKVDLGADNLYNYVKQTYSFLQVIKTSIYNSHNDELLNVMRGNISAFAGQSAVGKSALIKFLLPDADIVSGQLSEKIKRGKQTTRHCELFEVEENSYIVDTAGFTSLDEKLLPIPYFELGYYYDDFVKYLPSCKYKSCLHSKEDDCAVKDAVKNGSIDKARYERYKIILNTLKDLWVKTHG